MALIHQFKKCQTCNKEFSPKKGVSYKQWSKSFWCSRECHSKSVVGRKLTEEHKRKIGIKSKGHIVSTNVRIKISKSNTGKIRTPEMKLRNSLAHMGHIAWNKGKKFIQLSAEKHWNWKGGNSKHYKSGYFSFEYKQWRKNCMERDNYTCQDCGIKNCYLTVHHIKSFAYYPELRYEEANGKTLCEKCHSLTDNYRGRAVSNFNLMTQKC